MKQRVGTWIGTGDRIKSEDRDDGSTVPGGLPFFAAHDQWIACAYRDSHGGWGIGGGTVVSRDSDGVVRVFFGHVCGDPRGYGRTLEKFYANLIRNSGIGPLRERK